MSAILVLLFTAAFFTNAAFIDVTCDPEHHFACRSSCIPIEFLCDNVADCPMAEDEIDCNYLHTCPANEFMCRSGECLLRSKKCNGVNDCTDGTDEAGCKEMILKNVEVGWNLKNIEAGHKAMNLKSIEVGRNLKNAEAGREAMNLKNVETGREAMNSKDVEAGCRKMGLEIVEASSSGTWLIVLWILLGTLVVLVIFICYLFNRYPNLRHRAELIVGTSVPLVSSSASKSPKGSPIIKAANGPILSKTHSADDVTGSFHNPAYSRIPSPVPQRNPGQGSTMVNPSFY